MIDATFIEELMDKLNDVKFNQGIIANSLCWSAAYRFVDVTGRIDRWTANAYADAEQPKWMERALSESLAVIGTLYDYTPTGRYSLNVEEMLDTLLASEEREFTTDEEAVRETAEVTGRTEAEVMRLMEIDHKELQKRNEVQKAALRQKRANLIAQIENAIARRDSISELHPMTALAMADKALAKIETSLDKLTARIATARSAYRRRSLLADYKLLEATMEWLSDRCEEYADAAEQQEVDDDPNAIH